MLYYSGYITHICTIASINTASTPQTTSASISGISSLIVNQITTTASVSFFAINPFIGFNGYKIRVQLATSMSLSASTGTVQISNDGAY